MNLRFAVTPRRRLLVSSMRNLWLAGAFASAGSAEAATITVTDEGDFGTVSTCTLRQAIASANANDAGPGACVAGDGADTIVFAGNVSTVTLGVLGTLHLLDSYTTTISGGAGGVTIDGNNAYRVLEIPSGANAAIDHVTIRNGKADSAGGISCGGTLDLADSTISGNSAVNGSGGGIYVLGSASLTRTVVSGNDAYSGGGGVEVRGILHGVNSTLSGNTARVGAGLDVILNGHAELTDSTVMQNHASLEGGGVVAEAGMDVDALVLTRVLVQDNTAASGGGGLADLNSTVTITNSTFTGNSAPVGSAMQIGPTSSSVLRNCTVSGNQSGNAIDGPFSGGKPTLVNTIVANNTGGPNCGTYPGAVNDGGGNLDSGASCGFGLSSLSNASAALGALADNGGPTQTMMPGAGSAAIDAIDCMNAPGTDQRGMPRPQGTKCDIGAVELAPPLSLSVTDYADFAFYGDFASYVVTLTNESATDAISGVKISASGSAALDNPGTYWLCTAIGACTTTKTYGPLNDAAAIPAGASLTWLVTVPILAGSNEPTSMFKIVSSGAPAAIDTDTLAIFRATFED